MKRKRHVKVIKMKYILSAAANMSSWRRKFKCLKVVNIHKLPSNSTLTPKAPVVVVYNFRHLSIHQIIKKLKGHGITKRFSHKQCNYIFTGENFDLKFPSPHCHWILQCLFKNENKLQKSFNDKFLWILGPGKERVRRYVWVKESLKVF